MSIQAITPAVTPVKVVEIAGKVFSAPGPYAIAKLYAQGQISREQMLQELCQWDYTPQVNLSDDYFDGWLADENPPGTFEEVLLARRSKYISGQDYSHILQKYEERLDLGELVARQ